MVSLETIGFSALLGGARGFMGWYKNYQQQNANARFDFFLFAPTILGYIVGGMLVDISTSLVGMDVSDGASAALGATLTELVFDLLKAKKV